MDREQSFQGFSQQTNRDQDLDMDREQSFQGFSQQAVDENETVVEIVQLNLTEWATFLNLLTSTLSDRHKVNRQTGLKSQVQTEYGATAVLAKTYLDKANLAELKIVFKHLMNGLTNTNYPGNRKPGLDDRPSDLWEKFALHYLSTVMDPSLSLSRSGGKNDLGVDILIEDPRSNAKIVAQVKRGNFFKGGKGPKMVRELYGSMGLYKTKHGIIFTNESRKDVDKKAVRTHIDTYKRNHYDIFHENDFEIEIICIEDINRNIVPNQDYEHEMYKNRVPNYDDQTPELRHVIPYVPTATDKFRMFIKNFIDNSLLKTIMIETERSKNKPQSQQHNYGQHEGAYFFSQN